MKKYIIIFMIDICVSTACYYYGKHVGRESAYEDIISEKCWLNKETRDIDCIEYIKK